MKPLGNVRKSSELEPSPPSKPGVEHPTVHLAGTQVSALGLDKAKLDTEYHISNLYFEVTSVGRPSYGPDPAAKEVTIKLLRSDPAKEEAGGSDESSGDDSGSDGSDESSDSGESGESESGESDSSESGDAGPEAVQEAPEFPRSSVSPAEAGL